MERGAAAESFPGGEQQGPRDPDRDHDEQDEGARELGQPGADTVSIRCAISHGCSILSSGVRGTRSQNGKRVAGVHGPACASTDAVAVCEPVGSSIVTVTETVTPTIAIDDVPTTPYAPNS